MNYNCKTCKDTHFVDSWLCTACPKDTRAEEASVLQKALKAPWRRFQDMKLNVHETNGLDGILSQLSKKGK